MHACTEALQYMLQIILQNSQSKQHLQKFRAYLCLGGCVILTSATYVDAIVLRCTLYASMTYMCAMYRFGADLGLSCYAVLISAAHADAYVFACTLYASMTCMCVMQQIWSSPWFQLVCHAHQWHTYKMRLHSDVHCIKV